MTLHKDIPVGVDSSHPPGYVQSADPGAVGANKPWIDTTGGTGGWRFKVRNAADAAWETISDLTNVAKLNVAQSFTKPQRGAIATLVSASNLIAVDLALSDNYKITLAQNNTLSAPTNAVEGQSGVITFTQDGTGSRTMAYNAFWDFTGAAPALSTAAGAIDHLSYYVEPGAARARCQLSKE